MAGVIGWVSKQVNKAAEHVKQSVPTEEIPIGGSRMRIVKQLGQGGYAFVYLVEDVNSGRRYAMKRMLAADSEAKAVAKTEVKIMRSFKGAPNLVRYYDSKMKQTASRRTEFYILMEFCERGALLDEITERIERDDYYSERQILRMFKQTCIAVKWFHTRKPPIQHRDLKIENLLMTRDGTIKLCDFGSCTIRTKKYTTRSEILQEEERIQKYTTNCYMAPEMADLYKHEVISEKVDIWALGCILFVLAFFEHPFQDKGTLAIINGAYTIPTNHKYSKVLTNIIKGLLVAKPKKRPDIHMALQMCDDWERYLRTGKMPPERKMGKKVKSPRRKEGKGPKSDDEESSSEDEAEKRKKKALKKKKKLEKKRKKEAEKKAKMEARRRAAAKLAALKSPSKSDDFPVDWDAANSGRAADANADFEVDWNEGGGAAASPAAKPGGAWDPFAEAQQPAVAAVQAPAANRDIFSVLSGTVQPPPAQEQKKAPLKRLSGDGASQRRPPMIKQPSGVFASDPFSSFSSPQSQQQWGASPSPPPQPGYGQFSPVSPHGQQGWHAMQAPMGGTAMMSGGYTQQQQWQMMQMQQNQQREQQRMAAQHYRMQMQRQMSSPPGGFYAQQPPSHMRQQSDMSGLSNAFSNVNFGAAKAPAPAPTKADPFASNGTSGGVDPFSVGFNDHSTVPKPKKKSEAKTKEKDVFDSLGEFAGF
mmetsp:Transcript_2659/g.5091  ORF Transcript_2659/g.5091 Transcript_2659/m.5091 type:complete len:702 (+) Transcript_2659:136-2241(+)